VPLSILLGKHHGRVTSVDELVHSNIVQQCKHFEVWMLVGDVWVMRQSRVREWSASEEDGTVGALVGDTAVLQRDLVAGRTSWLRTSGVLITQHSHRITHIQSSSLCSELSVNEHLFSATELASYRLGILNRRGHARLGAVAPTSVSISMCADSMARCSHTTGHLLSARVRLARCANV
jgi:hypothetical protein